MKLLVAILLSVTLPAFGQTIKFSHEGQTNTANFADELLFNASIPGTTNFVTWRIPTSNVLALVVQTKEFKGAVTNLLVMTNGTVLGNAATINWTSGVTGSIAGAVATLGVAGSGGGGLAPTAPAWNRFATNASYTLPTNFYVHGWTAVAVAGTITLPSAATSTNLEFVIKDEGGNASATNIAIAATAGDRIDGQTNTNISVNYGSKHFYSAGGTNWYIH